MSQRSSMGGKSDVERLEQIYNQLEKTPFADRPEPPKLRESTGDPDLDAKNMVQDLMRFFLLICMEMKASPETMLYAVELFALNVFNAQDCPLPVKARDAIRRRAFDYYRNSLPKIP